MTTWYVTTGTSLTDSARCWKSCPRPILDELGADDLDTLSQTEFLVRCHSWYPILKKWRDRTFVLPGGSGQDRTAWAEEVVKTHFRTECWARDGYRALPAELSTLYWMSGGVAGGLGRGDTVRFVTGESNEAVAYLLVAMAEKLQADTSGFQGVTIAKTEPFALDPGTNEGFNDGFKKLLESLALGSENAAGLVLTGGYKAVLVALSMWIGNEGLCLPVCHTHEDASDEVIRIEAQDEGPPRARRLEKTGM